MQVSQSIIKGKEGSYSFVALPKIKGKINHEQGVTGTSLTSRNNYYQSQASKTQRQTI